MTTPTVGVVMGSASDWSTMEHAVSTLAEFGVAHEARVISAHRMPDEMFAYAESARARGLRAIIAGAGFLNALDITGRTIENTTVVFNGAGAAGATAVVIVRNPAIAKAPVRKTTPSQRHGPMMPIRYDFFQKERVGRKPTYGFPAP